MHGVSPQALALLERHGWPGNVRELSNVIERAMVAATGNVILPEHLPSQLHAARATGPGPWLTHAGGRRARSDPARPSTPPADGGLLRPSCSSLSRRTLYRKLDRHGIA